MMDPDAMFPDGFHPVSLHFTPDLRKPAWNYPRIVPYVHVKYHLTGFGSASRISRKPGVVDKESGKAKTKNDAYMADIAALGQLLSKAFCEVR